MPSVKMIRRATLRSSFILLPSLLATSVASANGASQETSSPLRHADAFVADQLVVKFQTAVQPVLVGYCVDCHNADNSEAGVRLDNLDPDLVRGRDAERWSAALDMINGGEMPPEDSDQPTDDERRALVGWMDASLQAARSAHQNEKQPGLRRLTKEQYANTLQDLLGTPVQIVSDLPDDSKSEHGFRNGAASQQTTSLHLEYYEAIARKALSRAIVTGNRPTPSRYRVTLGRDVGRNGKAARITGYQSKPISPSHVLVEALSVADDIPPALPSDKRPDRQRVEENIGVGMRGSHSDRYRVVADGIALDSALPHKEVSPTAWQGPSPNLKLLIRRCGPLSGPFALRVTASRAAPSSGIPRGLLSTPSAEAFGSLDEGQPQVDEGAVVLQANAFDLVTNMQSQNGMLLAKDVTSYSRAEATLVIENEGLYQIDVVHPAVPTSGMASIGLRIDDSSEYLRLPGDEKASPTDRMITPLCLANLEPGEHSVLLVGKFFGGLSHLVLTPLPTDHPISKDLRNKGRRSLQKYADKSPSLAAFIGTRTDDGMTYKTIGQSKTVAAGPGSPEVYEFHDHLENYPTPIYDLAESNPLSNILIVGVWNDHLVKQKNDQGPPLLIRSMELEAPYYPQWPPPSHTAILFEHEDRANDIDAYTRRVIRRFMVRAFRRDVEEAEVERYHRFWRSVREEMGAYEESIRETLTAVLCSPSFLYLHELGDTEAKGSGLTSKMSFFLWNSPPDDRLLKRMASDAKGDRLADIVKEMLADPKSWRFVRTFASEWLRLDRHGAMSIDVRRFPDYTRFVKQDMREETLQFLRHAIVNNLPASVLIDSDFVMLNQNLAEFYGIEGVLGSEFRPVPLPRARGRGGLLSQGAFLAGHSDGSQSHPIKRAVWLKEKILGSPPPPPPPNVPELDPDTPGFEKLTLKQQLELHRDKASCVDCHRKIDPYGVVFEQYDAVGRLRDKARGKPVDAASVLPDGVELNGVAELKTHILEHEYGAFLRSLVEHLFAYATGLEITYVEQPEIDRLVQRAKTDDRLGSILLSVVESQSFQSRTPPTLAMETPQ